MSDRRLRTVVGHLEPVPLGAAGAGASGTPEAALAERGRRALRILEEQLEAGRVHSRVYHAPDVLKHLGELEDWTRDLEYDVAKVLPGPLRDGVRERNEVLAEVHRANEDGANYLLWESTQRRYCKDGMCSNFVLPIIGTRGAKPPVITQTVILCHPKDCGRIARDHVKKQPNFVGMGNGIISTTDNDHWRMLRNNLTEAFHPIASLQRIFPRVARRARECVERLGLLAAGGQPVDVSEFLLHEALAQLMLGLFGFPEEFMDATNKRFRDAMSGRLAGQPNFVPLFMHSLMDMMSDPAHQAPSEAPDDRSPISGPLSRVVDKTGSDRSTKMGNIFIFAFAGHDTTGHTMTWLIFELCKQPAIQRRLQAEVDDMFFCLDGRPMEYGDLHSLKFMTRCIMETLRLWPSVPNGTYRELDHDDWIHGAGGERVHLPKGTYVQITTWLRHRDPMLWGADAHEFNPDRDFQDHEIWDNRGIAAFNPATERFSPFTYQPRDCIGKNFAQSEMRAIISHVLHAFSFELADPMSADQVRGVNYATMGPLDTSSAKRGHRYPVGLKVRATPRSLDLGASA